MQLLALEERSRCAWQTLLTASGLTTWADTVIKVSLTDLYALQRAVLSVQQYLATHEGRHVIILMPCAAANAAECVHTEVYMWTQASLQGAYLGICWVHILGVHRICQGHRQLL